MNIIKQTGTANTTACNRTPKYLVLHYTAGTSSKIGTAKNIAVYFSKPTSKASADFIVDDGSIVQYNADPTKRYCWAVGGSKYKVSYSSEASKYYGKAMNSNCISIEMCSNKVNKNSLKVTDLDWYLTDATVNNAVELSKYLMQLYNIPIENVIMHTSVNGKPCPQPWCINEAALAKWRNFKARLLSSSTAPAETSATSTPDSYIKIGQMHANNFTGSSVFANGIRDVTTKKLGIKVLQHAMNLDYKSGLSEDGIWGAKSQTALGKHYVMSGETQYMCTACCILLLLRGYHVNLSSNPMKFDATMVTAVKSFQQSVGLAATGKCDASTFINLIN